MFRRMKLCAAVAIALAVVRVVSAGEYVREIAGDCSSGTTPLNAGGVSSCIVREVVSDSEFVVEGGATVRIAPSFDRLDWVCGAPDRLHGNDDEAWFQRDRVRVGDAVDAAGTVLADGTLLAVTVEVQGRHEPGSPSIRYASSGVVTEVAAGPGGPMFPESFVMGGVRYVTRYAEQGLADDYTTFGSYRIMNAFDTAGLPAIAPGDAVIVEYVEGDASASVRTALATHVRPAGDGSAATGVITSVDAPPGGEGSQSWGFVVNGLRCHLTEQAHARRNVEVRALFRGEKGVSIAAGLSADVKGSLRDGVLVVEEITLDPAPTRGAKRLGRLRARGPVHLAAADGTMGVNGVEIDLAGASPRQREVAATLAVGDIVQVDARLVDGRAERPRFRPARRR